MIAVIPSATLVGVVGHQVSVEVHVSSGLPGFTVVGLPDAAVRESRDRVRAALLSSGMSWPLRRVTVNLAPSGVRKGGAGLDLPIAVGLMVASGELDGAGLSGSDRPGGSGRPDRPGGPGPGPGPGPDPGADIDPDAYPDPARDVNPDGGIAPARTALIGELGLDGSVRHVPGALALADAVAATRLVVPEADAAEAASVCRGEVFGVRSLRQLIAMIRGETPWTDRVPVGDVQPYAADGVEPLLDLADVRGQQLGRRALEVAAAGAHHLLMIGPPGSGKTMLAERLPGLLPPLELSQAIEVSRVHSAAGLGLPESGLMRRPPFRAPHHGASAVSLVGGGTWSMRPGEISLANHGVLFLDEMGEFPSSVLDALREPIEEGVVRVSRARAAVAFPARFLLVGAMNPCPCGEGGSPGSCRCTEAARARYARRLSAPLLDRFDLVVLLERADPDLLLSRCPGERSAVVAERVRLARQLARVRSGEVNGSLRGAELDRVAPLTAEAAAMLERHLRRGDLSARGYERVRRVARTIADLAEVGEALPSCELLRRSRAPGDKGAEATLGPSDDGGGRDVVLPERPSVIQDEHVSEALALRAARSLVVVGAR